MTALGHDEIWKRLRHPAERDRLVVTPLLEPDIQLAKNQAGIDVRLGRVFALERPWAHGVREMIYPGAAPTPALNSFVLAFGQPLIIHPHQFVLARTLELVRLPPDLLAYVIGRSSWGRRGLIVATAVVVHPGFAGPITLELRNLGEMPIALYPMDRVAQLVFHNVEGCEVSRGSQFSGTFEPSLGEVRKEPESRRLAKMAEEAGWQVPQGVSEAVPGSLSPEAPAPVLPPAKEKS
jgi:dCTP deaminase